jgi:uncharacterized membrane protein
MKSDSPHSDLQFERIVFFSDAVFAIAITLLIIEIKVPHIEHGASGRDFVITLVNLIPKFTGYFLSFFVIGAYWVGHHRVYGHIVRWNYGLIWRNILFLMAIAFMPFSTAFFSEYLSFVPLVLYSSTFAAAGIFQLLQWRYALKHGLVANEEDPLVGQYMTWRMTLLPLVGLAAIIVGFFDPRFAGMAFFLLPVLQIVFRNKFRKAKAEAERIENPLEAA